MLVGALAAYAVAAETGSPWVGVLAGAAAGGLLALVHAVLVLVREAEPAGHRPGRALPRPRPDVAVRRGLRRRVDQRLPADRRSPGCPSIPWLGEIFFDHDPLTYLSFARRPGHVVAALPQPLGPAGARRRRAGRGARRLRPLAPAGAVPGRVGGGALAGIGGAQLSTAYANAWFENMTAGPGLHRRGPGDLRRLAPAASASPAPTCSAPPSPCRPPCRPGASASTSSPSTPCPTWSPSSSSSSWAASGSTPPPRGCARSSRWPRLMTPNRRDRTRRER